MNGNRFIDNILKALRSQPGGSELRFLFIISLSAVWLLAITGFLTILYSIPRGFDWSDEAFYWMAYQKPSEFVYVGFFQWFGEVLLVDGLPEIHSLRISRLLLHLLSAGILYHAVRVYLKKTEKSSPFLSFLLPLLLLANWATYSLGPQSLSYNHLVLIILQIQTGIIFWLSSGELNSIRFKLNLVFLAITSPLLFLAKFPTGILFTFIWPTIIGLIQQKQSWKKPLFIFLSVGIPLIILAGTPARFTEFIEKYQAFGNTMSSHAPAYLLQKLWLDVKHFFGDLAGDDLEFDRIILFSLLLYFSVFKSRIALIILGFWITPTIIHYFNYLNDQEVFPAISAWIYVLAGGIILQAFRSPKDALIVLSFCMIPFAASLGTNNNLFTQITFYFPFFILATLWLKSRMSGNFGYVGLVLATLAISLSFYKEYWKNPYRLKSSITEQNIPFQIKNKSEILLLDAATTNALHELDILLTLNNINPENHYLCSYSGMMGAGLLLGYEPPLRSWNDFKEQEYNRYCWSDGRLKKDKPFIWLSSDSTEIFPRFLAGKNLHSEQIGQVELVVYQKREKVSVFSLHWK